jgi:hypothetical protein
VSTILTPSKPVAGSANVLILTSLFLSIANTLGSAGKVPALALSAGQSTDYWPMIAYTAGVVAGCFVAILFERAPASTKYGFFVFGPLAAGVLALICPERSMLVLSLLNACLGALLAIVLILVRGRLGEEPPTIARRNLTLVSAILSGMPVLAPLAISLVATDLSKSVYMAMALVCVAAAIASLWSSKISTNTGIAIDKCSAAGRSVFAVVGLICSNTCVLVAVLTLPIVVRSEAAFSMQHLLLLGACLWLCTNLSLVALQSRLEVGLQLKLGVAIMLSAFCISLTALATENMRLYFFAQVPVYVSAMIIQATLFTRIARNRKTATRSFGIQAGLQVCLATLVVAAASQLSHPTQVALVGQLVLLFTTIACCASLLFRNQLSTVVKDVRP